MMKLKKSRIMQKLRKMIPFAAFLCLIILLGLALFKVSVKLSADSSKEGVHKDFYYEFTDYSNENVKLMKKPTKVAILFSSLADVWNTAGGEISITVGESVERGFAKEGILLVDGGVGKTIDNELLLSYEPDFVIGSADIPAQVKTAELLRDAGIPCGLFHVETFEEYLKVLDIFTQITENEDAYETYGYEVAKRIENLITSTVSIDKKVLFIRAGSSFDSTKAKTAKDNFVCVMLKELGTYNIAENAPVLLDGLSFEEILNENPDYIFISTMGSVEAAKAYMDSVLKEEKWQSLDAVKNGKYIYLPKDLFQYKPNSRWDEAYEYLIDILKDR